MTLMSEALQVHDLEWVAQHRSGLKEVAHLDVNLARRLAGQLPAQGMREAFESVLVGDIRVAPDPALAAARWWLPLRVRAGNG